MQEHRIDVDGRTLSVAEAGNPEGYGVFALHGTPGSRLFWGPDEIRSRLADLMADALSRVWDLSESEELPFRRAALVTSIREVAEALEARGIHP